MPRNISSRGRLLLPGSLEFGGSTMLYKRHCMRFYTPSEFYHAFRLKGPKHEIFESGFFTQIGGLWLGELGTGEKN